MTDRPRQTEILTVADDHFETQAGPYVPCSKVVAFPYLGQYVVLSNIVSMSLRRKDLFEPYLKSFFVRSNSDPLHIRLLKLEILTNLATEANISAILREFQTYISQTDKEFVAATIQAIGRCASNIKGNVRRKPEPAGGSCR